MPLCQLDEFFASNCKNFKYAVTLFSQSNCSKSEYKFPKKFTLKNINKFLLESNSFIKNGTNSSRRFIVTQKKEEMHTLDLKNVGDYFLFFASPQEIVNITQMNLAVREQGINSKMGNIDFKEKIWRLIFDSFSNTEIAIGSNENIISYLKINDLMKFQGKVQVFDLLNEKDLSQIPELILNNDEFQLDAVKKCTKVGENLQVLAIKENKLKILNESYSQKLFLRDVVPRNALCPKYIMNLMLNEDQKFFCKKIMGEEMEIKVQNFEYIYELNKQDEGYFECPENNEIPKSLKECKKENICHLIEMYIFYREYSEPQNIIQHIHP